MSRQNLVFVVLLWLFIGLQNRLHSILTHILRTVFLRFPARCYSNSSQSCLSHEKILSKEWELYLFIDMIPISTQYLPCKQQFVTSNTGPVLVFPSDPAFEFRWIFVSWQGVLTTGHCIRELWEFCIVFRHEIMSKFNCSQESCINAKFAQFVFLW